MINSTAEYALRAVVFLGANEAGPISRDRIAQETEIPKDYLVRVLMQLDAAGIVASQRGPGGGYRINQSIEDLTVYDVIAAVSELPRIEKCPLGIEEHIDLCPLHARLDEVAELAEAAFRATPVVELLPNKKQRKSCQFPRNA